MFGGKKIKIPDALFTKLCEACKLSGSASEEEFAIRALQKEIDRVLSQAPARELSTAEVDDIAAKMKGLGYLE